MIRKSLYVALLAALTLTACVRAPSDGNSNNSNNNSSSNSSNSSSSSANTPLDKAKALVSGASKGRADAIQTFDGPDGLVGIVAQMGGPTGSKEIVWASPGLQILLPAAALDVNGNNMNEKALTEQNVYKSAEALGDEVADQGFIVGKSGPIVTAFMDANCSYCNLFYKNIMPHVNKGEVRVRFIMAGFLKPTSIPKAVAILAAKNPAAALADDEKNFGKDDSNFKVASNPEIEAKVAENTKLLGSFGPIATPALVVCIKGQPISIVKGMPPEMAGFIASLDTAPTHKACSGK